jgi:tetratricopeptide (TPR) repeat protein
MNTASKDELHDFEKSTAPEQFDLSAPSTNMLLPGTAATVSRRGDRSVEIDWPKEDKSPSTLSADTVLSGIEQSVRRHSDRFPRSARAHANLGIALLKQGESAEALKELEIALEFDPNNYLAGITLAKLHFEAGRTAEAERQYERLLAVYPDNSAAEIGLSSVLIQTERYDDAHVHLSKAATLSPRDPYVRFLLGILCLQRSDLRCALNEFRAASHLDFRSPQLYHAMGVAYALQGEHSRAEKAFKTALTLAPESAATVISLARTLLTFDKSDQAIEMVHSFVERHPTDLQARDQLALAYIQSKRYSMARAQIKRILELGGDTLSGDEVARNHSNIGVSLIREKSFDKAVIEFKLAIEISPKSTHIAYDNLARVYSLTDRKLLAIKILEKAVELFPSSRETRSLLSVLYAEQEKYVEAILQVEESRKFGPLSADNYASLGTYYGEAGFGEKAIHLLMEGYEKFPKSSAIINNLAYFLLMEGHISQAKEVLESRPRNIDDHIELVATLGLLHLKEGEYEAARRLYKRAESMAVKSSRKELARQVRQKMHLELARYYLDHGDHAIAQREIYAGLQEKRGRQAFMRQLEILAQSLDGRG